MLGFIYEHVIPITIACFVLPLVPPLLHALLGRPPIKDDEQPLLFVLFIGSLLVSFVGFIVIIITLITWNQALILAALHSKASIPPIFLFCLFLYWLRSRYSFAYGLFEVISGIVAIWFAVGSEANDLLSKSIGILGGGYIIVRGMDNMDRGLPSSIRRYWDRIFPKPGAGAVETPDLSFDGGESETPLQLGSELPSREG